MKKYTLKAFLVFILACGATALYSYSFPPWKVELYGVSSVIWGVAAFLFGVLYHKAKNKKSPYSRLLSSASLRLP